MKISCTRENLHQGLTIASHLTTKNVNLPILQNVMMKAEGGTIRFSTTNLEIAVHCTIRGKVDEPGEYTIPSKLFADYVSLLPNETVNMETDAQSLRVACGTSKTKLNGMSASEFPLIPEVQWAQAYAIPVDAFKLALSRVLFATANNESRPELTGVNVQFLKGDGEARVVLAATDSYRLAEQIIPGITDVQEDRSVIVPARTLSEVNRILSVFKDDVDSPSSVTLKLSDSQIVFSFGPVELISRTIDGNYPPYRQIIPKDYLTEATLDRADFIKSVKAASLFSRNGLFDVVLSFDPAEKRLAVSAMDATRGENRVQTSADVQGNANSVTLNHRYLLDGLNAMDAEQVTFKMIDTGNACCIVPKGKGDYLYIVMPIRQ